MAKYSLLRGVMAVARHHWVLRNVATAKFCVEMTRYGIAKNCIVCQATAWRGPDAQGDEIAKANKKGGKHDLQRGNHEGFVLGH